MERRGSYTTLTDVSHRASEHVPGWSAGTCLSPDKRTGGHHEPAMTVQFWTGVDRRLQCGASALEEH